MKAGLRRFVDKSAAPAPPQTAGSGEQTPGEKCEMCAVPIEEWHGHVVDLEGRGLMCTCRPCALLFTQDGAGGGRFRAVPERYRYAADVSVADATWDALGIPVAMAFFFANSAMERTVAFYPSPAGATESLLPLDAWSEMVAAIPSMTDLQPDVEALLVYRGKESFEFFSVPIDACYQLVGLVRMYWKGFDGGEEAWDAINSFFEDLRERSEKMEAGDYSA